MTSHYTQNSHSGRINYRRRSLTLPPSRWYCVHWSVRVSVCVCKTFPLVSDRSPEVCGGQRSRWDITETLRGHQLEDSTTTKGMVKLIVKEKRLKEGVQAITGGIWRQDSLLPLTRRLLFHSLNTLKDKCWQAFSIFNLLSEWESRETEMRTKSLMKEQTAFFCCSLTSHFHVQQ